MYCSTKKNWAKKIKKNCRGLFAEGLPRGPRQRIFFKKIKNLCRGPWIWALGKELKKNKIFAEGRGSGPSAKNF